MVRVVKVVRVVRVVSESVICFSQFVSAGVGHRYRAVSYIIWTAKKRRHLSEAQFNYNINIVNKRQKYLLCVRNK